ncbi:MAG TPA: hypothetical protein QF646_05545 [Candidatus Poseidoniales archaeon]|nr:hypothetical protein [Candidatus Poseidoniales archaeon]
MVIQLAPGLWMAASLCALLGSPLLVYLAQLTYRARPDEPENRFIALMLAAEGIATLVFFVPFGFPVHQNAVLPAQFIQNFMPFAFSFLPFAYLAFAGTIDSPLAKIFSHPKVQIGLLSAGFLFGLHQFFVGWNVFMNVAYMEDKAGLGFGQGGLFLQTMIALLLINFYLILTLFFSRQRYEVGSTDRMRIRSYLTGYALRYLFVFGSIGLYLLYRSIFQVEGVLPTTIVGIILLSYTLGNVVFGVMFSLGILRSQILGVERLFKTNINRAALGGIMLSVFFLTVEIFQNYLSSTYGYIGGMSITAVMMVTRVPLMKIIDKGTDSVVQTSNMDDEEGAGLYREQYEMAMADGVITNMERSMLRLTAKALGLNIEQIQAIESEIGIPQHSEE